jgi:nucleoside-diphosphate-sugar epimerase
MHCKLLALGQTARIDFLPENKADMQDTAAEIAKARKILRWQPEIAPHDGLRRAVAWHQENAGWLDGVRL